MTRAVPSGALLVLGVLMVVAAGCGAGNDKTYTFDPNDAAVKVDTRQLQELKADAGIAPCPAATLGTSGKPGGLPDATLPCLGGGRSVDLAGLRGPLLLNFWGQFCGPCRQESPLLQQLATASRGRVQVIGLDFYDPRPDAALRFAGELGLTYPQIADPDAATRAVLHISGLPMTFFVDRSGRITYTHAGAITSQEQLDQLVQEHLGVSVASRGGS